MCRCFSFLHSALWCDLKCSLWHSTPQYDTEWQREQRTGGDALEQLAHTREEEEEEEEDMEKGEREERGGGGAVWKRSVEEERENARRWKTPCWVHARITLPGTFAIHHYLGARLLPHST